MFFVTTSKIKFNQRYNNNNFSLNFTSINKKVLINDNLRSQNLNYIELFVNVTIWLASVPVRSAWNHLHRKKRIFKICPVDQKLLGVKHHHIFRYLKLGIAFLK